MNKIVTLMSWVPYSALFRDVSIPDMQPKRLSWRLNAVTLYFKRLRKTYCQISFMWWILCKV